MRSDLPVPNAVGRRAADRHLDIAARPHLHADPGARVVGAAEDLVAERVAGARVHVAEHARDGGGADFLARVGAPVPDGVTAGLHVQIDVIVADGLIVLDRDPRRRERLLHPDHRPFAVGVLVGEHRGDLPRLAARPDLVAGLEGIERGWWSAGGSGAEQARQPSHTPSPSGRTAVGDSVGQYSEGPPGDQETQPVAGPYGRPPRAGRYALGYACHEWPAALVFIRAKEDGNADSRDCSDDLRVAGR